MRCWEHTVSSRGSLWCLWKRSCTGTVIPPWILPAAGRCAKANAQVVLDPAELCCVAALIWVAQVTAGGSGCSPHSQFCLQAPVTSPHTCWSPQPRLLPPSMHIQHSLSLPPMSLLSPLPCIHLLKLLPHVVFHLGFFHPRPVFYTLSSQLLPVPPDWPLILLFKFRLLCQNSLACCLLTPRWTVLCHQAMLCLSS